MMPFVLAKAFGACFGFCGCSCVLCISSSGLQVVSLASRSVDRSLASAVACPAVMFRGVPSRAVSKITNREHGKEPQTSSPLGGRWTTRFLRGCPRVASGRTATAIGSNPVSYLSRALPHTNKWFSSVFLFGGGVGEKVGNKQRNNNGKRAPPSGIGCSGSRRNQRLNKNCTARCDAMQRNAHIIEIHCAVGVLLEAFDR